MDSKTGCCYEVKIEESGKPWTQDFLVETPVFDHCAMTAEQRPTLTILYMYCQLLYFHLIMANCLQTNLTAFDKLLAVVYSNCSNLGPYHVYQWECIFVNKWVEPSGMSFLQQFSVISMFNMTRNNKQLSVKRGEVLALHLACNR